MSKRRYEPMWSHLYRIFADGAVVYATTSFRKFQRKAQEYAGVANVTFSEPR